MLWLTSNYLNLANISCSTISNTGTEKIKLGKGHSKKIFRKTTDTTFVLCIMYVVRIIQYF